MMTLSFLAVALGVVAGAALIYEIHQVGAVLYKIAYQKPVTYPSEIAEKLAFLEQQQHQNSTRIDQLRLAVSDGIERVDRAEKRVQKTVSGARRLLKENGLEHAGLEAEAEELRSRDGEPEPELPEVFEDVEPTGPTGYPGVTHEHLRALAERVN